jgi:hypothetical protein
MDKPKQFSSNEAKRIGNALGVDWSQIYLEQFRMGLSVELEHGTRNLETNVTNDDVNLTGKIALAPERVPGLLHPACNIGGGS